MINLQNIKNYLLLFYNFYKNYKEFLTILLFLFIIINILFFSIFYNIHLFIFFYNNFFISNIDNIIYFFKINLIKNLQFFYDIIYNIKIFLIQKYYSIFEYSYMKEKLKNNYNMKANNRFLILKKEIYIFFYKNIFFPYFNIFQNTEYYKRFNPQMYGLDFIYSYKRKGECARRIDEDLIEYLPDFKKMNSKKNILRIQNHYNYIYTTKHIKREKALSIYNDLYIRRNFFIINNSGFLSSKEILHYDHDLDSSELDDMSIKLEKNLLNKIAAFNFRRKDSRERLTSFENFDNFQNEDIIRYENMIDLNSNSIEIVNNAKNEIEKIKYKIFIKQLKKNNYYDNLLTIDILEKNIDNIYLTGTTEIYYFDKTNYHLINFIGLTDYFFYFLYYSFIEIPLFFEDFYIDIKKDTNFNNLLKNFFNEALKLNNFYIILMFSYSFYLIFKSLILNELDLLYALLFFKRHLTLLIIIGFLLKFNLDILDPLTFELFLLLWIPGIINYIVYEEWWWVWWSNFEKVKFHFTFNYEGVLYCPINIYIIYIIAPHNFQSFLIFKILVLHYLIFHINRVDFKWKYIVKKNFFYYIFLAYNLIFFNFFIIKEELKLLKKRFNLKKNFKNLDIFYINFNLYTRNYLININNFLTFSIFILLKKYIQLFIYYIYMFFFIFFIFILFFKIIYNFNFIFYFNFIENNLDLSNFIKTHSNHFIFLKNNINLALYKEYQINQRNNYYKYNILYNFENIKGFRNKLFFKFHYPGLIFYRTSRQFNGNLYWLYFQGGNNYIGESYYKATILNNFYKKNLSYFYKNFIFDRKNYNWTKEQKFKYTKISNLKKNIIKIRKFQRLIPNYSLYYNIFIKKSKIINNFNFITYNDFKFISLITKNFYKTTTFYTNNKTYFFSLYTYKYFRKNYPVAMDDLDINLFIRKMYLHARAWGKYHMGSNFLFMYSKFLPKKNGKLLLNDMIEYHKIPIPFKILIKDKFYFDLNKILFYNKYIPNRLDYIEFHSNFYKQVYSLYEIELNQCILDKNIVKKEILVDNRISIFTLIFNYSEYLKLKTNRDLTILLSIKARLPLPHEYVEKKTEYI